MNNKLRMLLLKILEENGNVSNLEKLGYQYAYIAAEYSKLINDRLIILGEKEQFVLSDIGKVELNKLKEDVIQTGKWIIEPYIEYKTDKMNKYDIYLE